MLTTTGTLVTMSTQSGSAGNGTPCPTLPRPPCAGCPRPSCAACHPPTTRGLHSTTIRLIVSAFCGIWDAFRDCLGSL